MRYAVLRSVGDGSAFPRGNVGRRLRRAAHLSLVGATLLIGGAAAPVQPSQARTAGLPEAGTAADPGAPARPVAAWNDFCARYPSECTVDLGEPALVALTPALWHTLTTVNRRVNARIKPITDMAHWGVVDRWDFPDDGFGDCEDIQLLKRRMLVERRLPRRALRMTVVIDEIGEGHAVLMVRTDRGDLILDNKTNAVLPWTQTGYTFVKRESQEAVGWMALGRDASPLTAANR